MLNFHPIQITDRAAYLRCLGWEGTQSSSVSFGNVFLWDLLCQRNLALCGERMCAEYLCRTHEPFFAYPIGRGELRAAVEGMEERAAAAGRTFSLQGVTAPQCDALRAAFPGRYEYLPQRGEYDYVYSTAALSTLAGKKLHGKRNHCNRFEAAHADWHSEALTPALFPACQEILCRWDAEKAGGSDDENEAIRCCLRHWDALGMEGTVLFADGQPVAFAIGELLQENTADIHFEKAREEVEGAYPMIAREFTRQLLAAHPALEYVNREEDMGLPGLRRAKEEWYPLFLLEKFTVRLPRRP